ncbi:MAG: hypothetical protein KIT89_04980 [Microcella sp.]|uniref:glycosyltransferase n=1 Tax=Microcella sp. TaxID=1913979 RepID=UPI0024C586B1|nr:nucleotide disphospho-sugar-binding domain-containing protein [Microcella sp.]UYN84537.1 MAG: hypothetical protein KIT89_04980 [Microcella sp.]
MSRYVLATVDAGGNVPPMAGIARELVRRGHAVTLLAHAHQAEALAATGANVVAYPTGRTYVAAEQRSDLADMVAFSGMMADRAIARDIREAADRERADAVLIDCLLPRAIRTLSQSRHATAVLVHTLWSYWRAASRGPFGLAVAARGSRMLGDAQRADLIIVATLPSLDALDERDRRNTALHHVGGVWSDAGREATPDEPEHILVSLSTTAYSGQPEVLQRIVTALRDLPHRVVVTTGPALDPGTLDSAANIDVRRWADHGALLPRATALVTHGGHSTTMRALEHGVPMVVVPLHSDLDQPRIAELLSQRGAAVHVQRTAPPDEISRAVQRVLEEPSYREAAHRLQQELRERDGAAVSADLLEHLAST